MPAFDVLAVGTPVIDIFANVDDAFIAKHSLIKNSTNFLKPQEMAAIEDELSGKMFESYPGDNARNVCETISRLGGKVAYAGRVADDEWGRKVESSIASHGGSSYLDFKGERTGRILCLITGDAERTFVADLAQTEDFELSKLFGFEGTKFVFATSITLLSKKPIGKATHSLFLYARARRMKTALSLESPKMIHEHRTEVRELMREADFVFMNEEEREALGVSYKFLSHLGSTVFLKNGKHGSMVYEPGKKPFHVPAFAVKKVVDTTGAGDAYCAGVLYGLSKGMPVHEAAAIGAKTGAACVSKFGASLPDNFKL